VSCTTLATAKRRGRINSLLLPLVLFVVMMVPPHAHTAGRIGARSVTRVARENVTGALRASDVGRMPDQGAVLAYGTAGVSYTHAAWPD
jgi:hypothetical protein